MNKTKKRTKRMITILLSVLLVAMGTACTSDKAEDNPPEQTDIAAEAEKTGHDVETQNIDEGQTSTDNTQDNDGRIYNSDGSYSMTTNDHLLGFRTVKDFDADGNLIKITNYIRDDVIYSVEEYDFDRDVLVITTATEPRSVTEYNVKLGESILYENFTQYYYHENDVHDFYIVVEYEARDDGGMNERRLVFGPGGHLGNYLTEFNALGSMVRKTEYNHNGEIWKLLIIDRDENDREISYRLYDKDGNRIYDD